MSDRPQSTAPPLDPLAHPLREAFVYRFRPEDAATLAGPATLAGALLVEGQRDLAPYLPDGKMPGDREQVLAIARDLDFSGRLLVELLQGSELSREEWAAGGFLPFGGRAGRAPLPGPSPASRSSGAGRSGGRDERTTSRPSRSSPKIPAW